MSDLENAGAFSLADIADLDATEIEELRFESLPAGVYGFEVVEADMDEKDNRDGDNRILAIFKFKVVTVESVLARGVDPTTLEGKTHTEKQYIVPDQGPQKLAEGVGRLKAFVWDLGCDNVGKVGDIVRATVGHQFVAKITERPNPNDKSSPFATLKLEKREKPKAA